MNLVRRLDWDRKGEEACRVLTMVLDRLFACVWARMLSLFFGGGGSVEGLTWVKLMEEKGEKSEICSTMVHRTRSRENNKSREQARRAQADTTHPNADLTLFSPPSRPLSVQTNDLIRASFPLFAWHIADTASVTYDRVYAWLEKLQWR